jgi:signal transduction histidine kinase
MPPSFSWPHFFKPLQGKTGRCGIQNTFYPAHPIKNHSILPISAILDVVNIPMISFEVFMSKLNKNAWDLVELLLPWLMLLFLGYITLVFFVFMPYHGIFINQHKTVTSVYGPDQSENNLKAGDIIQQVGRVTYSDTQKDLTIGYFENNKPGDRVEIIVDRQGQQKRIHYTIPDVTLEEIIDARLNTQWFTPYIFWLAGTVSLLFLRPRSLMRFMLALFCYLTAAWLSISGLSAHNYMNGSLLLRSAVWLSLPIYLHLHWLFPFPLRDLPRWVWGLLYGFAAVMAVVSWLQWAPPNLYLVGFLFALLGSLVLLGVHLITQPAERRSLAGLATALAMVLIPVVAIAVMGILNIPFAFPGIVVLGLAAVPGFYFFTLFRRQLTPNQIRLANRLVQLYLIAILTSLIFCVIFAFISQFPMVFQNITILSQAAVFIILVIAMVNFLPFLVLPALADEHLTLSIGAGRLSFSANRTASGVVFLLLESQVVLLLAGLLRALNFPGASELSLVLAVLVMGSGTLLFYQPFKRFFERTVLGITLRPETLAKIYSGRITTSLEATALQKLLRNEVLPSLLVRQFAQVTLQNGSLALDFGLRAAAQDLPSANLLSTVHGRFLEPGAIPGLPGWIRLVLPLQTHAETSGYWLLGQRDPDDRYSEEDIATLQALADQTALALVNIQQADNLRALYFADIDRNEGERLHLAAELHDDVLSQMSMLSQFLESSNLKAITAYDESVARIREIINGLRPVMLNFGLHTALEGLVDELNDRHPDGPQITVDLPRADCRYDSRVELYLFRVVQQACSNAIQHAHCQTIRISGSLAENNVELWVNDDGKGFPAAQGIDLPALLVGKHFGLAGMLERAALIGAQLDIQSQPGQGCQVNLRWDQK